MDLLRVEQQRQALEENLRKLRQSLKYWQTFEAEYEGLKEEIQEAQPVNPTKLTEISESYAGELVTKDVVRELAGLDKDSPRSGLQIVRDIERRQEYVQKNIETIQRRFFEAEAKQEEFDFAASRDSSGGLPLTEIHEELDDDDNVVSSQLVQPEASQGSLVESLRKAGLTAEDLDEEALPKEPLKPAITNMSPPIPPGTSLMPKAEKRLSSTAELLVSNGDPAFDDVGPERPPIRKKSVSFSADTKEPPEIVRFESDDGCKKVSFADKVAVAPAAPLPDMRSVQFSPKVEEIPAQPLGLASPQATAQASVQTSTGAAESEVQKELRASFKPGDKVKVLNDDDEVVTEQVILPENETEEDAQMRREMLDYHLNEVGHVVAEMDLGDDYNDFDDEEDDVDDDDTSSHVTSSTYLEDEDTPYTSGLSDEDEDEDEHGRTKRKVVTGDYRRKMLEMQQRLIGNLGPSPKDEDIAEADAELDAQDVRRLVIRDKRSSVSSASSDSSEKKSAGKKRVSFAEALDVAEPGSPPLEAQKHSEGEAVAPVSDAITERTNTSSLPTPSSGTPAKASKFKKARAVPDEADYNETPSGPPGRTLAETLVERPAPFKVTSAPSEEDPDPVAERRQLAAEYYRRRNEMVRQQGGFKGNPDEDEELGELMEERDGKLKKVSRFKAARIKPQ